jgi:hypothetical protein
VDCESSCGDGVCSLFEGNDDGEIETADPITTRGFTVH